jgi:hypothetical protein
MSSSPYAACYYRCHPCMTFDRCLLAGCLAALSFAPITATSMAAQTCGPEPAALVANGANIFSEQQEEWLGDAMADLVEARYRPVRDPAESAYLQGIADRLLAVLPPTAIHFRLLLVDSPEINGFSLAGGRIYITRKLVANANSEDEVASVIGHEMGHILSHQIAVETTADMKRLLNVSSVTDRADIYAKFQQLMDKRARDKHPVDPNSDEKQDGADRIGVYAAAAAGYRPKAYAEFWDRSFFVGGKTGNGIMDFFGATNPGQKRLRLIRAMVTALPPGCGATFTPDLHAFNEWKSLVLANQSAHSLTVADGIKLTPPLRLGIDRLRFSPDGKYILAQDESSIFVLSHEPFTELFRIEADRANDAYFTPDSTGITFSTRTLHTERWDIAAHKLGTAHEVNFRRKCVDSFLAPDGRTLVCVSFTDVGYSFNLDLVDVETGQSVFEQKSWFEPTYWAAVRLLGNAMAERRSTLLPRAFSPDGRRLLVGPSEAKMGFDLDTRTPLKIGGDLHGKIDTIYTFVGNDVAGVNQRHFEDSGLFSFPAGKLTHQMNLSFADMEGVTAGNYVLVRNVKMYPVALADLNSMRFVAQSSTTAMDMMGTTFVGESNAGSIQIGHLGEAAKPQDRMNLSLSPLGRMQSTALSPDGHYLALSARSRGAIWDLTTGQAVSPLKAFRGGVWKDGRFYAAFPDEDKDKKIDHLVEIDLATKHARTLPGDVEPGRRVMFGTALEWKTLTGKAIQLIAHSAADNSVRWAKDFPSGRVASTLTVGSGDVMLAAPASSGPAAATIRGVPALAAQLKTLEHKDTALLITDLAAANGGVKQQVVIEAPVGFDNADDINRVGDFLYVSLDDGNRTVVYSMVTGKQLRQFFGGVLAADEATGRIATANRRDELILFGSDGTEQKHLAFGSPIRYTEFVKGGTELVVLTADQQVRRITL